MGKENTFARCLVAMLLPAALHAQPTGLNESFSGVKPTRSSFFPATRS